MNKPTPAIDENGEFVVAKLRGGQQAAVFCIDPLCALLDSSIVSEWLEDGRWSHESKHDHYLDIVNLDEIRATVERARKARDAIRTAAGITFARNQNFYGGGPGQVEKAPAPARPSFAEALLVELEGAADGVDSRECTVTLADMLAWFVSARRPSEGSV